MAQLALACLSTGCWPGCQRSEHIASPVCRPHTAVHWLKRVIDRPRAVVQVVLDQPNELDLDRFSPALVVGTAMMRSTINARNNLPGTLNSFLDRLADAG